MRSKFLGFLVQSELVAFKTQNGEKENLFSSMAQESPELEIEDRFYGKNFIKLAQVERNGKLSYRRLSFIIESNAPGAVHTIKEYQMELKLSLAGVKEYISGEYVNFFPKKIH